MAYTANEQKIIERCNEVVALAKEKYGLDLSNVGISLKLKGRNAGYARWERHPNGTLSYSVRFNRTMINGSAFEGVLNETVPHEYAHIVCYMNPSLGNGHDAGWKEVCRELGGNGNRLHTFTFILARGKTYQYVTSTGRTITMGDKHHSRIQRGETLRYRGDYGHIAGYSPCLVLGESGVEFNEPVQYNPRCAPVKVEAPRKPVVRKVDIKRQVGVTKKDINIALITQGKELGTSYAAIILAMMELNGYDQKRAERVYRDVSREIGICVK